MKCPVHEYVYQPVLSGYHEPFTLEIALTNLTNLKGTIGSIPRDRFKKVRLRGLSLR